MAWRLILAEQRGTEAANRGKGSESLSDEIIDLSGGLVPKNQISEPAGDLTPDSFMATQGPVAAEFGPGFTGTGPVFHFGVTAPKPDLPATDALKSGAISREDAHHLMQRSKHTWLQDKVRNFSYQEVMQVYNASGATEQQKRELQPIIRQKRDNLH